MSDVPPMSNGAIPNDAVLSAAAQARLPAWAEARPKRYGHMVRVAELMGEWAPRLGVPPEEQARWRATGLLHDALRDAEPETLRAGLDARFRELPGYYLHGPAVAVRLEADGVTDIELLDAIRYHTLGSGRLGRLGRALIAADWLEPGRPQLPVERAALRARMPEALDDVFATIVAMRVRKALERGKPIRAELTEMWNAVAEAARGRPRRDNGPPALPPRLRGSGYSGDGDAR